MVAVVIRIDRLEIKMSGIPEGTVREIISGFEKQISVQAFKLLGNKDLDKIIIPSSDKIHAGDLEVSENDINTRRLGRIIANRVLSSIIVENENENENEKGKAEE